VSGRKRTERDGDEWTLMPQQLTAIDLLVSGKTITDTALALDVRRQTVSEWTNHNPTFQAALNSRRQEIWNGTADRLRGLLPRALDTLEAALDGEQPLAAAIHVLKACGLYGGIPAPTGPVDVEEADIAQRRRDYDRMLASLAASP
jgi:hypothetical protein